jgi:hypothetical protein
MNREILMYGEIPYPDIEVRDVQAAVRDGVRLNKPDGLVLAASAASSTNLPPLSLSPAGNPCARCPDKFFAIMKKCWNADRRTRWTFSALQRMIEGELRFIKPPPPRDIGLTLHDTVSRLLLSALR